MVNWRSLVVQSVGRVALSVCNSVQYVVTLDGYLL